MVGKCKPPETYGPRRFNGTWDQANQSSSCRFTASARIWVPDRNSQKGLMGQWPCRCTFLGQDHSIEFKMEQIGPAVVELQHLQSPESQTDGSLPISLSPPLFIVPPNFLRKSYTKMPKYFHSHFKLSEYWTESYKHDKHGGYPSAVASEWIK